MDTLPAGPHRTILRGWALLAVIALALAGLALLVPALSKMPGLDRAIDWPVDFFQKGLVAHVALSFIVWFLATIAMIALTALRPPDRRDPALPGGAGLALATLGTAAIVAAPFTGGAPSLNNYVPSIIHPLYFAGLALVAGGTLIPVLQALPRLIAPASTQSDSRAERAGLLALGLLYIGALAAVAIAANQLAAPAADYDTIERLFWGGGHLLQFVNVALLLVAVDRLGRRALGGPVIGENPAVWAAALLFLAGAGGLAIYGLTDIRGQPHLDAFTDLQYALGPPVLIALGGAVVQRRRWRAAREPIAVAGLIAAGLVFVVGCALGLFVDGADTRTPAHYHGVIGGINIALYALFYVWFLPLLGRPVTKQRLALSQIIVYAVGQTLFIAGLFLAGGMGAARKSMGAGLELEGFAQRIALLLRDFGLVLAVLASAVFIGIVVLALVRNPDKS
jgi:heme/copper-type cytochrome/quinol oxidase subunit 1